MLKILIAVLAALAAVFALQNMTPVAVTFIIWQFASPLAFILLGAAGMGFIIAMLAFGPAIVKRGFAISANKRHISDLEKKLESAYRQRGQEKAALLSNEPEGTEKDDNQMR